MRLPFCVGVVLLTMRGAGRSHNTPARTTDSPERSAAGVTGRRPRPGETVLNRVFLVVKEAPIEVPERPGLPPAPIGDRLRGRRRPTGAGGRPSVVEPGKVLETP